MVQTPMEESQEMVDEKTDEEIGRMASEESEIMKKCFVCGIDEDQLDSKEALKLYKGVWVCIYCRRSSKVFDIPLLKLRKRFLYHQQQLDIWEKKQKKVINNE